jgi:hypothetical protein
MYLLFLCGRTFFSEAKNVYKLYQLRSELQVMSLSCECYEQSLVGHVSTETMRAAGYSET